jgi:hypothetical protein
MKRTAPSVLVAAGAALFLPCLVACGGGDAGGDRLVPGEQLTLVSSAGRAVAHLHVEGDSIVEGRNTLLVHFEPATTELVGASALMPVHGHGFVKQPVIDKTDDDGYRMTDVIFYMSGLWSVVLDLDVNSSDDSVEFTVDVP